MFRARTILCILCELSSARSRKLLLLELQTLVKVEYIYAQVNNFKFCLPQFTDVSPIKPITYFAS